MRSCMDTRPALARLKEGSVTMYALIATIRRFLKDQSGPTATEYAIMLALIAAGVIVAMGSFGDHVSGIYSYIDTTVPI